jgi:hypothetical protein
LLHRPIVADSAQDLHALAQALAQQTPWAQVPETHSRPSAQKAPFSLRPQELSLQICPGAQLSAVVQAVKQRGPLQAKGAQVVASGATQAPLSLQAAGGV